MAEKRMINKSISVSEKVNMGLSSMFSRLLFTWMIPHADDFGRLAGSPAKVKALVVPMLDVTIQEVEESIGEMDRIGLIYWYEVNGERYIQIKNFEEHQSGLHKRTKSKFPEFPGNSRKSTEIPLEVEEKGIEENRKEKNGTEVERDSYLHVLDEFCKLHNKLDINMRDNERQDIKMLLDYGIPHTFIIENMKKIYAARTALGDKIRSFSYYTGAIKDAWEGLTNEQSRGRNQTVTPFRHHRKGEVLFSDDELDELNELSRLRLSQM